jgi:hypothetical protein
VIPDSLSQRAYAKHRGVSHVAVGRAIKSGRLAGAVNAAGKIVDRDLADRLWSANTDYTDAPAAVREKALGIPAAAAPADDLEESATDTMSTAQATRVQAIWKARQLELKFKEEAKQLVRVEDAEAERIADYSEVRTKLLGVPSAARQLMPHTTPEDLLAWENLIRDALEVLSHG